MIKFACEHCGKKLQAEDRKAGAIVTCPSCRQRTGVPDESAALPPELGETVIVDGPDTAAPSGRRRIVAVIIAGAFAFLLVVVAAWGVAARSSSHEPKTPAAAHVPPPPVSPPDAEIAFERAKTLILDHLKAPKTAEFPEDAQVMKMQPGAAGSTWFTMDSFVDSKNAMGVPIRAKWTVQLQKDGGGQWHPEMVVLDGEPVFLSPNSRKILAAVQEVSKSPWVVTHRHHDYGVKGFGVFVEKAPWKLTLKCDSGGARVRVRQGAEGVSLDQKSADTPIEQEFVHSGRVSFVVNAPNALWDATIEEARDGRDSPPPAPAADPAPVRAIIPPDNAPAPPHRASKEFVRLDSWEGKTDQSIKVDVTALRWRLQLENLSKHSMRFELIDERGKIVWKRDMVPPRATNRRTGVTTVGQAKPVAENFSDLRGKLRLKVIAHSGNWRAQIDEWR
jgi:hypothetical protein